MSPLRQPPSGGPHPTAQQLPLDLADELDDIRGVQTGLSRRFLVANGGGFVVMAVLAATAGNLLGARVLGRLPLGMLLCLLQLILLVLTTWLYDRASCLRVSPRTDRVRDWPAVTGKPPSSASYGPVPSFRTGQGREW
ncbi:protein of unknown function DUF485 [Actinobacteria bacterium OK074]|nr:protein of unknown function DUF485 [Actinobacteria bacterium OK074]